MQSSPPGERGTGLGGWGQEETAQEEEGRKGGGKKRREQGREKWGEEHTYRCSSID